MHSRSGRHPTKTCRRSGHISKSTFKRFRQGASRTFFGMSSRRPVWHDPGIVAMAMLMDSSMTFRLHLGIILAALCLAGAASADQRNSQKLIKIENGENRVDIVGDGTPGLVISGHRENFNAHSFDVVSFYVQADPGGKKQWLVVPIMDSKGKKLDEKFELFVGGG